MVEKIDLLKSLCAIPGISGDEEAIKSFILDYVSKESKNWLVQPKIIEGPELQGGFLLIFGKPRTAVFSHIDTVGYTVGYGADLIKVGGPDTPTGSLLVGEDSSSSIRCELHQDSSNGISYLYHREIDRGTCLSYEPNFILTDDFVESPYLDNRLGVFNALTLAESLSDGILAFSCYEEVGGGNAEVLGRYIYENYKVYQALISDITWVTSGVQHGNGVAISLRDSGIPRKTFLNKILKIAEDPKLSDDLQIQLEVESSGGSDGNALQKSAYPFDWCFIGAAEDNVHSPSEKVALSDIVSMQQLYNTLLKNL